MLAIVGFTHGYGYESSSEESHGITVSSSEEETTEHRTTEAPPPPSPPPRPSLSPTPPPLQPSPPTTTTTERIPLPFEKFTKELIRANNASIELVQLNLARYETQLNLNALNTLLPKLKQLRQNMTNLLASPSPNYRTFETQSTSLGEKLTEVELQINKNRVLLQRYEDSERDTQKHLEIVYKSMGNILLSQVCILRDESDVFVPIPMPIPTEPIIRTETEMRSFLEQAFAKYNDSDTGGSEIQSYLDSLNNPENRIFAYNLTSKLIRSNGARRDTLFVQVAKNIFKFPELSTLKTNIPATVTYIFSTGPKKIELKFTRRQIIIRTDGRVAADRSDRLTALVWNFHLLFDSEYFAIVHSRLGKALGFSASEGTSNQNEASTMPFTDANSIKNNNFYHWKIIAFYKRARNLYYINFINRQTGLALEASSHQVIGQVASDSMSQDWQISV